MRRLVYLTIALVALFSALVAGVDAMGAAIPYANSLEAFGFSVCDGKPCYQGITPGITTWSDVQRNFPEYPAEKERGIAIQAGKVVRDGNRCSRGWISFFLDTEILFSGDPQIVTLISSFSCKADRIITINTGPSNNDYVFSSLDQLIALYGAPCAFYLHEPTPFPATLFLEYPEMMVGVTVIPGEPTKMFPLREIVLGQNANAGIMGNCDRQANNYNRWHGFASIDYYRTMQAYSYRLKQKANQ